MNYDETISKNWKFCDQGFFDLKEKSLKDLELKFLKLFIDQNRQIGLEIAKIDFY